MTKNCITKSKRYEKKEMVAEQREKHSYQRKCCENIDWNNSGKNMLDLVLSGNAFTSLKNAFFYFDIVLF